MRELLINGIVVGVFSSIEAAQEYAYSINVGTFSIMPLGTFLHTNLSEKDKKPKK